MEFSLSEFIKSLNIDKNLLSLLLMIFGVMAMLLLVKVVIYLLNGPGGYYGYGGSYHTSTSDTNNDEEKNEETEKVEETEETNLVAQWVCPYCDSVFYNNGEHSKFIEKCPNCGATRMGLEKHPIYYRKNKDTENKIER